MPTERIPLQRAVVFITDSRIVIQPSRAQIVGSLLEIGMAAGAVLLMILFLNTLPILVLLLLLIVVLLLGPIGVLGLVFGMFGTAFLMERERGAARWQQGFLGMGIGTTEYVAFPRVARVEVSSDADVELPAGDHQDVITWEIAIVKDNDRRLPVGTVIAARPLAEFAVERANRLGAALAEMAGVEAQLAPVPASAVEATEQAEAPERPRRRFRRVSRHGEAE